MINNKYNTNMYIQNNPGSNIQGSQASALKFTDFQIKYATSITQSLLQPNKQTDQSIPLQGQSFRYNVKKLKTQQSQYKQKQMQIQPNEYKKQQDQQQNQDVNLLTQSLVNVRLDNLDATKQKQNKEDKQKYNNQKQCEVVNNNLSTTPEHFTVSRVHKVNSLREYQSVRSQDNFQIKQIFYQPKEIQLPAPIKQQGKGYQLQDVLIPCTFVEITHKQQVPKVQKIQQVLKLPMASSKFQIKPQKQKKLSQSQAHQELTLSKIEPNQKNKIITDVLLDKITQLQSKIKSLEEEKKAALELNNAASDYQSTPQLQPAVAVSTFGSIKKNDIAKKFSTVTETQETNGSQFRVRQMGRVASSEQCKIHSNIYNIMLAQNKHQSSVKQQIQLLKKKLQALQTAHSYANKPIKNNTIQPNFKLFQNKPQQKLCTPNRRELGGKIVRRTASKISQSPQNTYRTNTEQSLEMDPEKGFIRSGPQQFFSGQDSNVNQYTKYSNINEHDTHQNRKKGDSSAIFRKNLGPAITHKKQSSSQFSKSKTLQFHPTNQKYVVLDSKQTQQLFKNQSISPILQQYNSEIYIPNLDPRPTPNSSSDQLVQIGKLTFRKFGCEMNQNTVLNVKKFKNCVLFSLGPNENILWHYEGRLYYGGWKTYANGEGEKYGKGIQYVPGKYKYKGSFQDGKRSGQGILIGDNGSIYIGSWFDGLKHGKGKLIQSDGSQYHGDWKSGKKSGFGKIFYQGNLEFEGNFVGGMKHGFGKQTFQNGDYYEGQYLSNKFQGKGTYIWASKAVFTGQFRDGKRHGHGIWRSGEKQYDQYQGQYLQDNKNGYGVYKWANGAVYKGNFKNDLKHGQGTMTYDNGKVVKMVWDKGNVQKTLSNSKYFEEPATRPQNLATKNKLKKSNSSRSNIQLQSAKSLKSERSLPKGLSLKKQMTHTQYNQVQSSPKVQFRSKVNHTDLIKIKVGSDNSGGLISNGNPIKDPPYKGMQTSSNINMNI